ncbi:hypothetical protein L1049_004754 [Liquidambar formosana]|uniref:Uncharacterized protein n=1 Tax=Liquidambar formosana TaxID=63359 RepID=A0AAP0RQ61_LIQFO
MANSGPGASISSGFGGLGLEGMVGTEDSVGESGLPPGVGNSGVMSGDKAGGEYRGGYGNNAGDAEIVDVGKASEELVMVIKTMTIAKSEHMAAIK